MSHTAYTDAELLEGAVSLLREASHIPEDMHNCRVSEKGPGNYVTEADLQTEAFLKEGLAKLYPAAGFLAEESGAAGAGGPMWIIDPIDGTGNYLKGYPYSLTIALLREGTVCLGAVYCPRDGSLYTGLRSAGAWKQARSGRKTRLLLEGDIPGKRILLFGVPYDRSKTDRLFAALSSAYGEYDDVKRIGPASVDICRVAEGRAEAYMELDLQPWDVAAGGLILEEAGGRCERLGDMHLFGSSAALERLKTAL
jgi:myo-inositol-1(or 4)-monophosphatase